MSEQRDHSYRPHQAWDQIRHTVFLTTGTLGAFWGGLELATNGNVALGLVALIGGVALDGAAILDQETLFRENARELEAHQVDKNAH